MRGLSPHFHNSRPIVQIAAGFYRECGEASRSHFQDCRLDRKKIPSPLQIQFIASFMAWIFRASTAAAQDPLINSSKHKQAKKTKGD